MQWLFGLKNIGLKDKGYLVKWQSSKFRQQLIDGILIFCRAI